MAVSPALTSTTDVASEVTVLRLAREIAMGMDDVETILERCKLTSKQWEKIEANQYFQAVLQEAATVWTSALNTEQRVKVKAAAVFEEWLLEATRLAHDPTQPLSAKVELMKLMRTAGGVGISNAADGGGGERLSVTINLGADNQLKIEKMVTSQVIEGHAVQEQ